MRTLFLSIAFVTLAVRLSFAGEQEHGVKREAGFVPDEKTAIAIAVAIWSPIYGEKKIQKEKPFKAVLRGEVWTVEGTLPKGSIGGVAIAEISKDDARILRVSHGK
jgi:hypothetical protein